MACEFKKYPVICALLCSGALFTNFSHAADSDVLTAEIPGGHELILPHLAHMDARVQASDDRALTVRVRAKPGYEPMSLMLTFFENPRGRAPSREQSAEMVARMAERYVATSVEGEIGLWEIDTLLGPAIVSIFNDRRYAGGAVPAGEFSTISVGQVATDDVAVAITLLTNGTDGEAYEQALGVIGAFAVLPKDDAMPGLPAAPAGYQWEACREIKGALLRPEGWHFRKRIDGNQRAYFISKEDLNVVDQFTTGLSFIALVGYGKEKRVSASEFAKNYIERAASSSHIRKAPWRKQLGPFVSHGVVITTPDARKGDFVSHMLVIANEETGTVYIVIFESPVEDWAKMKAVSHPMLEKLFIDSDI